MSRRKQLLWIYLLAMPVVLVMALLLGALLTESVTAHASECQTCHDQLAGEPAMLECEDCHEVSGFSRRLAIGTVLHPKSHFDLEMSRMPLEGWTMTSDLPNWNALIDERLSVLEIGE